MAQDPKSTKAKSASSGSRSSGGKDDSPIDWRELHLWHIQPVRDVLVLAIIVGLVHMGYVLRVVTVPMLLALMLAYLFEPLVKRLCTLRRVTRPVAVGGILATVVLVFVLPAAFGLGFAAVQTVGLATSVAKNTGALVTSVKGTTEDERRDSFRKLPAGWRWISGRMSILKTEVDDYRARRLPEAGPEGQKPAQPPTTPPDGTEPAPGAGATPGESSEPVQEPPRRHVGSDSWKLNLYDFFDRGIAWVQANAQELAKSAGQRALSGGLGAAMFAVSAVVSIAQLAFTLFITGFFFFFFSTGWGKVLRFSSEFIPRSKRPQAFDLVEKMDSVIAGFVRGRLTICAILGGVMIVAYWLIGVPMPFVLGAIVGMMFIVPFIHVIGVPIAMLLLWLDPGFGPLGTLFGGIGQDGQVAWWWVVFAPMGVYGLAQFLDDWVLTPWIAGDATGMDTPTILFASLAGGVLGGLYGVLLAIPVAACLKIMVNDIVWPRFKQWAAGKVADPLPLKKPDEPAAPPPPPPPPEPKE